MEHGTRTWGTRPIWVSQDRQGRWWAELPNGDGKTAAKSGPWPSQEDAEQALCSFLNMIVALANQ